MAGAHSHHVHVGRDRFPTGGFHRQVLLEYGTDPRRGWRGGTAHRAEDCVDGESERRVGRHAGHDDDHPAVHLLKREPARPLPALLLGALHSHDADEATERDEGQLIARLADTELEQRGAESDGERTDGHTGPLGGDQVPELVHQDQHIRDQ